MSRAGWCWLWPVGEGGAEICRKHPRCFLLGLNGMDFQRLMVLVPVTSAMLPVALLSQATPSRSSGPPSSLQNLWAVWMLCPDSHCVWLLPAHPALHSLHPTPCSGTCWEVVWSGADLKPECSLHSPGGLPASWHVARSRPLPSVWDEEVRERGKSRREGQVLAGGDDHITRSLTSSVKNL